MNYLSSIMIISYSISDSPSYRDCDAHDNMSKKQFKEKIVPTPISFKLQTKPKVRDKKSMATLCQLKTKAEKFTQYITTRV